jgi:serine/threonine protein kinase/tetratricopeptide (TPR) repeat protein
MPFSDEPTRHGSDPGQPVHEARTLLPASGSDGGEAGAVERPEPAPGGVADRSEFSRALIEIGLIDEAELEAFAADSTEGVLGLSRALVKAGKLTPYQAAAVYQKKSRGLLIGNYLILDKLGQGGMGVVFKARHRRLGHVGALKILPPSFARDRDAVLRFRREVEAAGRLKHPNLVAAQDADEDRGVHFLVMDYVEGRDLDRIVRERGPMPVMQAIDCLIQAARGLEAAHAQGIIHRDIKPGNLMLDASGIVRVLDLGLARIVDAANPFSKTAAGRLTQSGMYMGTIDYMAPEQAEDSHRVDHRVDIYSLGCTLFYLFTGKEPFVGETVLKRLIAHMERPAPSLRMGRPQVSPALDAAYLRMMAKRPQDRPASMTEVIALLEACKLQALETPKSSAELKVFDEPVQKRAGAAKTKGQPSVFGLGELFEGPIIEHELNLEDLVMDVRPEVRQATLPPAPKPAFPKAQPLSRSATTRRRVSPNRRALVLSALAAIVVSGVLLIRFALFRSPAPDTIIPVPVTTTGPGLNRDRPPPPPPVEETRTVFDGKTGRGWMLTDRKPVPSANIQPDGLNPRSEHSRLLVYEQPLGDFVFDFDYKLSQGCSSGVFLRVSDLSDFANTGIEVALDDTTGAGVRDSGAFYDLVAPRVQTQKPAGQWNHMTIAALGARLAVSLNGTAVTELNVDEWSVPGKRPDGTAHKFKNVAIASLARSGYLGLQNQERDCWFKNIVLRKPPSTEVRQPRDTLAVSRVSAPATQPVPEPYVEVGRFAGHTQGATTEVAISPDGRLALSCGGDLMVRLWEIETRRELHRFPHANMVWSVAFSPDGRRALSGSHDTTVRLWDLTTGREIFRNAAHHDHVKAVAFLPDGQHALSVGDDDAVILWNLQTRPPATRVIGRHESDVECVAITHDGRFAASAAHEPLVRVWDCKTWNELAPLSGHKEGITTIAFSQDCRRVLTGGSDGKVILWDFDSRKELLSLSLPGGDIATAGVFLPDGRRVVAAGNKGQLAMWNLDTRALLCLAKGPSPHVGVACLPDGRKVLTSDEDGIVRIWSPSGSSASADEFAGREQTEAAGSEPADSAPDRPDDMTLSIKEGLSLAELGRRNRWQQAVDAYTKAIARDPANRSADFHQVGGRACAELGRWKQAAAALERSVALDPGDFEKQALLAHCYLALNDRPPFRRLCEAAVKQHRAGDLARRNSVAWQAALMPDALGNYADVLDFMKFALDRRLPRRSVFLRAYGALAYRAGRYEDAANYLKQGIDLQLLKGNALDWVFMAMARHRLKLATDKDALRQAVSKANDPDFNWQTRLEIQTLLEEARRELGLPALP